MYQAYPSSVDPNLVLYADFQAPPEPRPILVTTHGWHGRVKTTHADNVSVRAAAADWFRIAVEMRGRGDSGGKPDANGWELQDVVDAVTFAKQRYADRIQDPDRIVLSGGSGGGANVFGLLGKFPDFFSRALSECGISDFARWYRNDAVGEFRDELDVWVGVSPDADPEAYASRSGLTTAGNLCTPLIVFHGDRDPRCPVEQSRLYVDAVRRAGKGDRIAYYELKGVGHPGHYGGATPDQLAFRRETGKAFLAVPSERPALPSKGRLTVGGFLKARPFELILDDANRVAEFHYDLDRETFALHALKPLGARLRLRRPDGRWDERRLTAG